MKLEAKLYLVMMTFLNFSLALSGIFVNIFIWNIDNSFALLAFYSLSHSIAVLVSFPACAWLARQTSPMSCSRIGILLFIVGYSFLLWVREDAVNHIFLLGAMLGLATSFFVIGQHMQIFNITQDRNRDRFLYILSFLTNGVGMLAPMISGFTISRFIGMKGYYIVFSISLLSFLITALVSLKVKGKKLPKKSSFKEVWKNPTREWRGMYWVSIVTSMVEGTYSSFLVTIMTFSILQSELSLGGYNTFAALMGLMTSLWLAKISRPELRMKVFTIGAFLVASSSIWISIQPSFLILVIYAVLSVIGFNLMNTTLNAWMYASIEFDKKFEERRLDYIVVREIPLGLGRMMGIGLFFLMYAFFDDEKILPISFALFGSIFVFLIPALRKIWSGHHPTI
ncbi:MFS transporter [Bacillus massiliigorillae]|uniref:MFS transporter n=1 Tax=Bacillus massiliigorillae TaxID=1243664 RepID=UPI0003A3253C|nr:MFS transporter [Bacillus massiliigorillae]